jgi:hypothetical protein
MTVYEAQRQSKLPAKGQAKTSPERHQEVRQWAFEEVSRLQASRDIEALTRLADELAHWAMTGQYLAFDR